jgi:glucose-6-phosphate isomerase
MDITRTPQWAALEDSADRLRDRSLREFFAEDAGRIDSLCFERHGLLVDFSKQRLDRATLAQLVDLARAAGVERWRDAMFAGDRINSTEDRAVLHVALRHRGETFPSAEHNVMPEVRAELTKMRALAQEIRDGRWTGFTGQAIRHVVSIGIGGSDLGPKMATRALQAIGHPAVEVDYVSNLDGAGLAPLLARLDPRTTLFIVASKTFTTQETLTNARTARDWLHSHVAAQGPAEAPAAEREARLAEATARHFLAVSAAPQLAIDFGVAPARVFRMWDWVGGRYSLWSAVGLPLMIEVGPQAFDELLAGAAAMDEEFRTQPLESSLPVLMGLIGIWNTDFLGADTLAVLPYNESLRDLPAYLQQLEMESNGKAVGRDGEALGCRSNPIVWGEIGINGQHAFFQLLHQGGRLVPCDFIAAARADYPLPGHQDALLANCFAQSAALAFGRTADEARAELEKRGTPPETIERLLPHKVFPGNQPSTTILLSKLSPRQLGALIALYEHKVFVQGVVWGLNSFDQWGVELGKEVARKIQPAFRAGNDPDGESIAASLDASTRRLVAFSRTYQ